MNVIIWDLGYLPLRECISFSMRVVSEEIKGLIVAREFIRKNTI